MLSIPAALQRPVNPNKPAKVVVSTPTSKLPGWRKDHLKAKAEALGEGDALPKFVSSVDREWFQYYLDTKG